MPAFDEEEVHVTYSQGNKNELLGVLRAPVDLRMKLGALKQYNRETADDGRVLETIDFRHVEQLLTLIQETSNSSNFEAVRIITQTLGDLGQKKDNVTCLAANNCYKELSQVEATQPQSP